jgi:hypothetical protein
MQVESPERPGELRLHLVQQGGDLAGDLGRRSAENPGHQGQAGRADRLCRLPEVLRVRREPRGVVRSRRSAAAPERRPSGELERRDDGSE